jgi:tetratricopeptide (TPR) repeat protein
MGWFEHCFGNHRTAAQHFERALELAKTVADHRLIAQLHINLGTSFYHKAEFVLAADHLSRAIRLRREVGSSARTSVIANSLGYLALVDAERGDFAAARTRIGEALAIVRELRQRQLEASNLTILAWVDLFQGEWDACIRNSREMRAIADAIGAPYIDCMSQTTEGYALAFGRGDPTGLDLLRAAVMTPEKTGGLSLSIRCSLFAEVLALDGREDEAVSFAERALARAEVGDRIGEIQAHRALGVARAHGPNPRLAEACACLETGVKLAEERGAMREAAVTRLQLAETLASNDNATAARSVLAEATAALRAFGMGWYAARAETLESRLGLG